MTEDSKPIAEIPEFTSDEEARYSRHFALPKVGREGQKRLRNARVLIVGAGGLGSPVAYYLAAAGVGHLTIVDGDKVEVSNLQRQILHSTDGAGISKGASAAARLTALNPNVEVTVVNQRLDSHNARQLIREHDFVVDCVDNLDTKLLINDTCTALCVPFSYGGISEFSGQTMTVIPGSADLRFLFGNSVHGKSSTEAPAGPFGAVAGVIGSVQAAETLKYLLGIGDLLTNRLLRIDTLAMRFTVIKCSGVMS